MNQLGALDTKTSIQVMDILKKISKDKLIIMVTHNPELAEKYSSRIIKILDGTIIEDTNPIKASENISKSNNAGIGKTAMKFFTAFRLSLNNLLTKKGRTILVAFAGSIGIIGIALIQAVSNGFQNYVDSIQEDTLTSYPLSIMQESTDMTSMLLSMRSGSDGDNDSKIVKEQQYMSKMLGSINKNDLKSFKKYLEENYNGIRNDISSIKYSYSVDPIIYTKDAKGNIAKLNPSNLFSSFFNSNMLNSFSAMSSIYSQMIDDKEKLNSSYDVLAGHWPEKYNEMVVVLSDPNEISDLLVYSLGLRDTNELNEIVTKIMSGEPTNINNEPLKLTYEDLMNIKLKLIKPVDMYRYNEKYDVYEDMTEDEKYLEKLYNDSIELKIVGVVSAKEGTNSMALNPGVAYTSDLITYIINNSKDSEIVKKQLQNEQIDVFSGSRFDSKTNGLNLDFADLISIDNNKLQSAFNINIDQNAMQKETQGYMNEISNSVTTDIGPAKTLFENNLINFEKGMFDKIEGQIKLSEIENIVNNYLDSKEANNLISKMEKDYVIPKDAFKTTYSGLLKGLLQIYINSYYAIDQSLTTNPEDPVAIVYPDIVTQVIQTYNSNVAIVETSELMAKAMTEAAMKKAILTKVGELINNMTKSFSSAFNVDQDKIANSFKLKMTEDEITRIVTAMMTKSESSAKTNLISLGYQDIDEPTYISFYFNSFEGKEHFISFIDKYNEDVKANGDEEKEINYSDTTGILMNSVKTIVNAVTYVLIAFVSISLVVSSIMIGIITYISVYERTKEIGILRAIGASKHNISSIFNAETFIIGLLSGIFGICIAYGLIPIINSILHHFAGNVPLNAILEVTNAISLIILSVILTLIGGLIPAKSASKKDPVIALRTE